MPSISLIRKLSVLGVAVASLGASTASASAASDVWLWACHGPSGNALDLDGSTQLFGRWGGLTAPYGDGCSTSGTADGYGGGGVISTLPTSAATVEGTSEAFSKFDVPAGVKLTQVKLTRRTAGFTGATQAGNPIRYEAVTAGGTLESTGLDSATPANFDGEATLTPADTDSGNFVQIGVICDTPSPSVDCTSAPVSVSVNRVGLRVAELGSEDASKPSFAVGGTQSPAAKDLSLDIQANDPGIGLKSATAYLEGAPTVQTVSFGGEDCEELTPGDATVDLPLQADCPNVGNAKITVNTRELADGVGHKLVVRVEDWAGNVSEKSFDTEIANNVNLGTNTQTLSIGTSGSTTPNATTNNNANGGTGGVAGQTAQSCSSPRLSFSLSQKPMRISNGVPVLQSGKRYRFNGRLTCVIKGKRQSAPKRARVDILNKIGKKTYNKAGTTVRDAGKLTVILAYKTSRTITFRFTSSDGKRSQVSIKVKVEKKKTAKR